MLHLSAKRHRSLIWWEDALWKTFWETIKRTKFSIWCIGWVSPKNCERPVKNPLLWKESFTWIVPRIRFVRGVNLVGGVLIADLEELETMDASEIFSKRLNAKEVIFPKGKRRIYFSNRRWTNQNPWRRSGTKNTLLDTAATNSRRKSRGFSWRIRRVSSTTSWLTSGCRWSDKWLLVHVRKLHIPPSRWAQSQTLLAEREESFPIPLKYIDVSRTTHTNLDVMQERRIDDYWNIDGSRDLSHSWTVLTQFILLDEKPPDGYMWSWERLTRKQLTSRPDDIYGQEIWDKMGKNAKLKERLKWSHRQRQKITKNLFHWPWGQGTQRNHQECSQEIGNANGPRYALQDKQEQSAWFHPW